MNERRRLTLISYFLAVAIFLLTVTGDGAVVISRFAGTAPALGDFGEPIFDSTRSERLLMPGTAWETTLYIIESPREGPTVMITGGIHGDEPAGYLAADGIASWAIDSGTLVVLPRANIPAILENSRNAPGIGDLNRSFPGRVHGDPVEALAYEIYAVVLEFDPDWLLDLHEAEQFERFAPGALGQTFIYPEDAVSIDILKELLAAVNRTISAEDHHFLILRGAANGSLIQFAQFAGAEAVIVESTQQLPLPERINHHRQAVASLLYLLGITVY